MKRLLPILLAAAMFGAITNARASDTGGAADSAGALIDDLVVANHILYIQGVLDAFGHVSGRNPQNPEHFFMSRALAPGLVTASDIMEFDLDGKPIDQSGRRMYVERYIHAEIYRARPEVMGVVHSHSPGVLPFGVSQTPLRAMVQTDWFLGDAVPVFDAMEVGGKFGFLINTPALGKALAQKLDGGTVLLLRAHGDAVVGRSVREAVSNAIYTELVPSSRCRPSLSARRSNSFRPRSSAAKVPSASTPTRPAARSANGTCGKPRRCAAAKRRLGEERLSTAPLDHRGDALGKLRRLIEIIVRCALDLDQLLVGCRQGRADRRVVRRRHRVVGHVFDLQHGYVPDVRRVERSDDRIDTVFFHELNG